MSAYTTVQVLRRLVILADNLRTAQKAYMDDRGNEDLGRAVGKAANAYDNLRQQVRSIN